jgi:iterative type I PKS product template protein
MFGQCVLNATGMLSVALDPAKLQEILVSLMRGSSLTISCYNSPQSCVISGPISELEVFKECLDSEVASKCTWLDVPFAFHSPAMFPVLDDLLAIGNKMKARPPSIPVISTVFGRVIMPGDRSFCTADYFAKHCASPVKFVDAVESYLTHPTLGKKMTMWLEIGPHPCLSPILKSFPSISKSKVVASLHRKRDNWAALSTALASFYLVDLVNWRAVFDQIGPVVLVSLPSYPFSHKKFWVAFEEPLTDATRLRPGFSFIRSWENYPKAENGGIAVLDSPLSYLRPYIEGHRVGGVPLCPASVYIELVASSTTLALQHLNKCPQSLTLIFNNFTFTKPLTVKVDLKEDATRLWIVVDTTGAAFTIKGPTISSSSRDEVIYVKGEYKLFDNGQVRDDFMRTLPLVDCYIEGVLTSTDHGEPERFSTCTIYDLIFPRIVEYSKEFQAIRSLSLSSDGTEAVARIRLDRGSQSGNFVFHPLFMDTLLQVPGFVANLRGGQSYAYICSEIACITVLPSLIDTAANYTIYSKHTKSSDSIIAESYAIREGQPRIVVATVKGIRFQCVRLSTLESGKASKSRTSLSLAENTSLVRPLLEFTVLAIVANACKLDANAVTSYDDLDCLGVDSIMWSELCYDLNSTFPNIELQLQDISSCRNIQMIVEVVLTKNGTLTPVSQPNQPRSVAGIKRVVAHVLDINENSINDYDNLSYLGLDSLSSIEVIHKLNTQFKIDLPSDFLSSKRTISDIGIQLASLKPCLEGKTEKLLTLADRSKANSPKPQIALDLHRNIYLLQMTNPSNTPLVLIHDGSGLTVSYHRIWDLARGVYCINNPKFVTSQPWSGIGEIAASYAESIVKGICGPVILGGDLSVR